MKTPKHNNTEISNTDTDNQQAQSPNPNGTEYEIEITKKEEYLKPYREKYEKGAETEGDRIFGEKVLKLLSELYDKDHATQSNPKQPHDSKEKAAS